EHQPERPACLIIGQKGDADGASRQQPRMRVEGDAQSHQGGAEQQGQCILPQRMTHEECGDGVRARVDGRLIGHRNTCSKIQRKYGSSKAMAVPRTGESGGRDGRIGRYSYAPRRSQTSKAWNGASAEAACSTLEVMCQTASSTSGKKASPSGSSPTRVRYRRSACSSPSS